MYQLILLYLFLINLDIAKEFGIDHQLFDCRVDVLQSVPGFYVKVTVQPKFEARWRCASGVRLVKYLFDVLMSEAGQGEHVSDDRVPRPLRVQLSRAVTCASARRQLCEDIHKYTMGYSDNLQQINCCRVFVANSLLRSIRGKLFAAEFLCGFVNNNNI